MRLTPPKQITFIIAVVLGVLGTLGEFGIVTIGPLSEYSVAMIVIGFFLLVLACLLKDL